MPNTPPRPRAPRTRAEIKAAASVLLGPRPRISRAAVGVETNLAETAPEPNRVGELWLYGVVGGWWRGFDAESVSSALRDMDVDHLHVRIHSPGGDAMDGVAIGNLLRNFDATVTVVVDGLAASAASVIAIAGDEIVMCPGSQMMLHDASTIGLGNAADLRLAADWVDSQSDNYAGVYAHRAGGTVAQWREIMLANEGMGTWYTAEGTVTAGLADKVGTVVAVGSPPTAPEDQLDDGDTWARAQHDLEIFERCVAPAARAAWRGERLSAAPKPPTASAEGSHPTKEELVDFTPEQIAALRTQVGFPEDADAATITAAVSEALTEHAEPVATAAVPAGHIVIPEAQLRDLTAGAAAGRKAAQTLHERDRKALLDANRTKFIPGNRASWEAEYDRDPEATRAHFATAPVLIPADELGHEVDAEVDTTSTLAAITESDVYKNWSN